MTQLAYEIKGTGDPVLLLHAFPLSGAMWRVQTDKLSRSRRVIVPDLPGFGKSARQKTPSIAEMARAVAALLDELSINEPVFTAGLSMGGYVAFEFYRQFPKRVNALGLISTRAKPDTEDQKIKRREMADKVRAGGLAGLAAEMPAKLLGATTLKKQKDVAEAVKKMILAGNPEGTADALTAMAGRADSSELLKSMRIPVLIVAGAEDAVIPAAEAEAMHKAVASSELEVVPQAGHLLNLEAPARLNEILHFFLEVHKI